MMVVSAPEAPFRKIMGLRNRPGATDDHGFRTYAMYLRTYNPIIEIYA